METHKPTIQEVLIHFKGAKKIFRLHTGVVQKNNVLKYGVEFDRLDVDKEKIKTDAL